MKTNNEVNPSRILFARKRRKITSKKLSENLGITSQALSYFENGHLAPNAEMVNKISKALHFPEEFFYGDNINILSDEAVSFRSMARMTSGTKNAALAAGTIGLEFASWIEKKFKIPKTDLPDLRELSPSVAAESLRNYWSIGQRPISNMIHLLESKGVFVFSLVENTLDMDAFSLWQDERPYVFLNTKKTIERTRYDAAHELGHLVLHRHGSSKGKLAEAEANQFASAFLMPESSVKAKTTKLVTFNWVLGAKIYWKVSVLAFVRRLYDLKLINEYLYKSFMIENNKRGGAKTELNPINIPETSKLLNLIFQSLRLDSITKYHVAKELNIHPSDLDTLIFNLSLTRLEGGSKRKKSTPTNKDHQLKLVHGA